MLYSGGCLVPKSCLTLVTPWTVACQASLSMGFFRQEYWSGLPFPSPVLYVSVIYYFQMIYLRVRSSVNHWGSGRGGTKTLVYGLWTLIPPCDASSQQWVVCELSGCTKKEEIVKRAINISNCWQAKLMKKREVEINELFGKSDSWKGGKWEAR